MSTEQYIKLIYCQNERVVAPNGHRLQSIRLYTTDDDLFGKIDWIQMGKPSIYGTGFRVCGCACRQSCGAPCIGLCFVAEEEIETYFMNV